MKIATTIGEVYAYTSTPAEAVRFYEGTGFKYLDYSFYNVLTDKRLRFMTDEWKDEILEVKTAADELGFSFVQAHAPCCELRGEGMEDGLLSTIRSIEACGMLGIKNMVIHAGCFPDFKYPQDQLGWHKANEPFFKALIPAMEKHGVHILFENTTIKHCGDGNYFTITGKDLADHVAYMNHPLFGAAWDVGHAHMDGLDHHDEIMDIGKALKAIHVHDNDGKRDLHTMPFLGTLEYDSLMRGLIDSGFDGYFTLESDGFMKYGRHTKMKDPNGRLVHPSIELKKASLSLLYFAAKDILEAYNLYED